MSIKRKFFSTVIEIRENLLYNRLDICPVRRYFQNSVILFIPEDKTEAFVIEQMIIDIIAHILDIDAEQINENSLILDELGAT